MCAGPVEKAQRVRSAIDDSECPRRRDSRPRSTPIHGGPAEQRSMTRADSNRAPGTARIGRRGNRPGPASPRNPPMTGGKYSCFEFPAATRRPRKRDPGPAPTVVKTTVTRTPVWARPARADRAGLFLVGGLGRALVEVEHPLLDGDLLTILVGLVGAEPVLQPHAQTEQLRGAHHLDRLVGGGVVGRDQSGAVLDLQE